MITQSINLNLIPGGIPQHIRVSQYDEGSRILTFVLYNGTQKFTTLGLSAEIRGTKPDGLGFAYGSEDGVTYTAGIVTCNIKQQMAIVAGKVDCELIIRAGDEVLGTANFILDVEKAALNNDTDISESELPAIIALASEQEENAAASAAEAALSASAAATSATNAANSATAAAGSAAHADETAADVDEAVQAVDGVVDTTYGMQDSLSIDVDGNPIDGYFAAGVADKLIVDIQPTQDLHGYDHPWVGGSWRNNFIGNSTDSAQYVGNYYVNDSNHNYSRSSNSNYNCFNVGVLPNTLYCMSLQGANLGTRGQIRYLDSEKSFISGATVGYSARYGTFTTPNECAYIEFSISKDSSYNELCINISDSSFDGQYEPYSNICPISGISELGIKVGSKNIAKFSNSNRDTYHAAYEYQHDNEFLFTASGNYSRAKYKFTVEIGKTYTVSFKGFSTGANRKVYFADTFNDWSGTYGSITLLTSESNYSFTFTATTTVLSVIFYNTTSATTGTMSIHDFMLEEGASASSFVHYVEPEHTVIDLDDTRYGGTLDVKTGVLTVTHFKVMASELTWSNNASVTRAFNGVGSAIYSRKTRFDWDSSCYCNSYEGYTSSTLANHDYGIALANAQGTESERTRVYIRDMRFSDYTEFVASLSTNDVEMCLPLATPITVQLDPATVNLFKGYNRITTNGNTIMHLSAVPEKLINYIVNAFGTDESGRTTASRPYAAKEYFYKDGFMYKVTSAIAQDAAFTEGTNCSKTTIFAELTALNA